MDNRNLHQKNTNYPRKSSPPAKRGSGNQNMKNQPSVYQKRPLEKSPNHRKKSKGKLSLIFLIFLIITAVVCIFIIKQKSSKNGLNSNYVPDDKNNVKLSYSTKSEDKKDNVSAFATLTEDTAKLNIDSEYGILIDLEKNEVIADKKGDEKIYPASMTKMMTLIVACENIKDLSDTFTFTAELLDPLYQAGASQAGFAAGETVCLEDMLYGCILPSGADATVGLANYVAGSEKAFVKLMNAKAKDMGLKNTHFVTASGLHDDNHYSTCSDIAMILKYAISNENMRKVLSTYQYTTKPTPEHPDGILLTGTMYSRMNGDEAKGVYVMGGKTGYTIEGRNCLASFAANCTEATASETRPQYLLVTAYAIGEYTPIFDAIKAYGEFCGEN